MCGVAGGIRSGLSRQEAAQVTARLAHRGPDDSGIWMDGEVWLGNTRLAIQDISQRGHQPMQTADGRFTLVFNGEIYNHLSLRRGLQEEGAQFSSSCDTETLLYAFAAWGADCLQRLEGDFAFAVYDALKKEVFIARDAIGVKPLYYYWNDGRLLFGSELKALLDLPFIDYSLKPENLYQYLLFQYSPTADTPFLHFKKLLPGQYLCLSLSDTFTVLRRHYTIPLTGKHEQRDTREWVRILDGQLSAVVASQLHSDAPLGLTLSGGLDSSLIAALARKDQPEGGLHAFCVNTAGAMKEEGFDDDFAYAQTVAKQHRIRLHEVPGAIDIAGGLDAMVWQLDEPQADPAALHMAHISAAARDMGIKVLLSGTGGDDVFSGYRRHQALPYLRMLQHTGTFPARLTECLSGLFPGSALLRRARKLASGAGLSLEDAMIQTHFWAAPESIKNLFSPEVRKWISAAYPFDILKQLLAEIPAETGDLNRLLFLEMRAFLPHHNLAYMDKMSMAHSVEVRVPFADKRIVSLAARMPSSIKMRNGVTKYILREVAKQYLPAAVIQRKKTGFGAPLRRWMRGGLMEVVKEQLLDESFLRRGIFEREAIVSLIRNTEHAKTDGAYTLFSLLCIASWLRQFAPSA